MKTKILNFLLIITSLCGYLEWSGNNHIFLFKAEADIISKLFTNPISVLHPFTILPIIGQLLLLITLFQKYPSKILTFISIGGLGLLLGFMCIIGLISLKFKIIISTIPFIIVSVLTIINYRKAKLQEPKLTI
jgi:hypothetical protein